MKELRDEKQWLANIKAKVSTIKTATPAENVASNQRHQKYQEGGVIEEEAEERRPGEE